MNKIIQYLSNRPGQYIKLDEISTALLVPRTQKITNFDRAWKELIVCGHIECIGNEVRINQ